jgi:hypothetical protein
MAASRVANARVYNPRPDRLSVVLKRRCIVAKLKRNDEAFFHAH